VFQIHDITDQKTRQLELERRNRQLDQFASVVSHDLRNPLSVASGSLELARQTGDSDHFDRVERAHERMHGLIEQVLSLSRDEEEMQMEPHPFAEVTRTAWAHVDTKEATLTVDAAEEIVADRDQLLQLLENAFRNSVEHAGSDCRISVRTVHESPSSDPAVDGFMISDDGPGIPPDERESVFDHGYTTEADGTGLGLAIIERITRAHDWSIRATEGPEGGLALVVSGVEFHRVRSAAPSA
jgi:signal transduction histidine kinase